MGIRLAKVPVTATTICAETFVTVITVSVPAPNVLEANVFGSGIFQLQLVS